LDFGCKCFFWQIDYMIELIFPIPLWNSPWINLCNYTTIKMTILLGCYFFGVTIAFVVSHTCLWVGKNWKISTIVWGQTPNLDHNGLFYLIIQFYDPTFMMKTYSRMQWVSIVLQPNAFLLLALLDCKAQISKFNKYSILGAYQDFRLVDFI